MRSLANVSSHVYGWSYAAGKQFLDQLAVLRIPVHEYLPVLLVFAGDWALRWTVRSWGSMVSGYRIGDTTIIARQQNTLHCLITTGASSLLAAVCLEQPFVCPASHQRISSGIQRCPAMYAAHHANVSMICGLCLQYHFLRSSGHLRGHCGNHSPDKN